MAWSLLVEDDFESAVVGSVPPNWTPSTTNAVVGSTLQAHSGTKCVRGNVYGYHQIVHNNTTGLTNCKAACWMYRGVGCRKRLITRYTDAQNFYCLWEQGGAYFRIYKMVGGVFTLLGSATPSPEPTLNAWHFCEFENVGTLLTARMYDAEGGSLLASIEVTDGDLASGYAGVGGFYGNDESNTDELFDDFKCYIPSTGQFMSPMTKYW